MTIFASEATANTFDYRVSSVSYTYSPFPDFLYLQPGDIGYIPPSYGHYIENTGDTTLTFLELFKSGTLHPRYHDSIILRLIPVFNADKVQDISLQQWLALTPPALVKAHLGFDDATIAHLSKKKQIVVGPSK